MTMDAIPGVHYCYREDAYHETAGNVGTVIWGMRSFGVTGALIGALFYQLGNLVPNPIKLSRNISCLLLTLSAVFGLAGIFQPVFYILRLLYLLWYCRMRGLFLRIRPMVLAPK